MTDDLSLLKPAAIAIGGEYIPAHEGYCLSLGGVTRVWNPLMDSGDALELLVALDLSSLMLFPSIGGKRREFWTPNSGYDGGKSATTEAEYAIDPLAATRRAIVRAAAALGAAMEGKSHE